MPRATLQLKFQRNDKNGNHAVAKSEVYSILPFVMKEKVENTLRFMLEKDVLKCKVPDLNIIVEVIDE